MLYFTLIPDAYYPMLIILEPDAYYPMLLPNAYYPMLITRCLLPDANYPMLLKPDAYSYPMPINRCSNPMLLPDVITRCYYPMLLMSRFFLRPDASIVTEKLPQG